MKPLSSLTDDELAALIQRQRELLPDTPLAVQQSLIALWHSAPPPVAAGPLARILARLSFDSWAAPALAAELRSLPAPTRHLLYSAEGRDVDLRIAPQADAFVLTGQILGPDEHGAIALTAAADSAMPDATGGSAHRTELNSLGEFRLEGVPRGRYRLTIIVADAEIELPPVDLGPAGADTSTP